MFKKTIVLFLLIGFSVFVLPSESRAAVNEPNKIVNKTANSAIQRDKKKRWRKKRWEQRKRWERRKERRDRRRNRRS